jgi:carbamoyl-phosphate synthase large subunit
LLKDGQVYVIETNLRASRTFPFISKVTGVNLMELFVDALFVPEIASVPIAPPSFVAVKAPQFSFSRLTGADPVLGVEMASTGEVACFGESVEEAYLKARLATGGQIPRRGIFLSLSGEEKHTALVESLPSLQKLNVPLYATEETWTFLSEQGIEATLLDYASAQVERCFRDGKIDLAIIVVAGRLQKEFDEHYAMRRLAVDGNIPLITKIKQMRIFLSALVAADLATLPIKAWDEYSLEQTTEEDCTEVSLL